jgi:spore coat protein U-like protein
MRKTVLFCAGIAALASTPAFAAGQQATGTVDVSLNVSTSCSVSAQPLSFGSVTALATAITASSATTVKCTPGAAYSVYVDFGKNAGAGTQRKMKSAAGDFVNYDIYSDSSRTTAWTTTSGVTGSGTGSDQPMTLYGSVPVQSAAPAGDYADQVTVTVNY